MLFLVGRIKGICMGEYIMEHIAHTLKKDPLEVRKVNLIQENDQIIFKDEPSPVFRGPNMIPAMLSQLEDSAEVSRRKRTVDEFNRVKGTSQCYP